jgi:serine/threonine-protein kinase RsbW
MKMVCVLRKESGSVDDLFAFVGDFFAQESIDEQIAFQMTVAAEELFTNLVKHSKRSQKPVRITLERKGEWLELELVDYDAEPFDITTASLPDLDVPIEKRRHGGMGLHLVRKFADDLSYRHESGNGIFIFKKHLGDPSSDTE